LAQTKNNDDADGPPAHSHPDQRGRSSIRNGQADHPPSGTVYLQGGKAVSSLGVHERWDSDVTMRYSRNLDPR